MKCPNCGANLEPNKSQTMNFCPYCGNKMEIVQEPPKTIAGAIHGIAKSAIDEVGKQLEYNREHAEEIEERKRKRREKEHKKDMQIAFGCFGAVIIMLILAFILAESEKAEKKAGPIGMRPAYMETIHYA